MGQLNLGGRSLHTQIGIIFFLKKMSLNYANVRMQLKPARNTRSHEGAELLLRLELGGAAGALGTLE